MDDLQRTRYYDTQIAATKKLMDYVVHDANVWDQMASYERHGRLEYFSMLQQFIGSVRTGYERGRLTKRQERELRNLERLVDDALGTIKILKDRDAEMLKRERGEAL